MYNEDALVVYRGRPARIRRLGEKLELETEGGEPARVRPKDVTVLHPGPLRSLADLRPPAGAEIEAAWEILAGTTTDLRELADLAFGAFTPATAWAAYQLVAEGLYFRGEPDVVIVATPGEVATRRAAREAADGERHAWSAFLARLKVGRADLPEDERFLREIETFALGRAEHCRALRDLGREETPEAAHAILLSVGRWTVAVNPYPARFGIPVAAPSLPLPPLVEGAAGRPDRLDLTHLSAYAIDDAGTDTPDDAVSLDPDGRSLWVHVADAAALVLPDSPLDLEARARGASSYLPDGNIPMLPAAAIPLLGLGLAEVSSALSFCIEFDAAGNIHDVAVFASRVRVQRLTYERGEEMLAAGHPDLHALYEWALRYRARRAAAGAVVMDLPEIDVAVVDGRVHLRPVLALRSRVIVEEAMVAAGEAVARYVLEHDIPAPFATQEGPEASEDAAAVDGERTLAAMFALRRTLKRRQYRSSPGPHAGLGLPSYVQVTSPLRRYLDLVVHQQLRAHLAGQPPLGPDAIVERVGAADAVLGAVRQAESLSNRHWTYVYLLQNPGWQGEGVLVEKRGLQGTFLIPALDLEVRLHLPADLPIDTVAHLAFRDVDLPRLDPRFRLL